MAFSRTIVSVAMMVNLLVGTAVAVNIETVPVGNPGNAADRGYDPRGYGSVAYTYNIGKYEVTAGQYTEFLNKVAATDTWSSIWGCKIQRSGVSGSYTYSVAPDYANRPVNYVSWGDAARFANWLHNNQPTGSQGVGTTETGAYTLNGARTNDQLLAVTREADWKWAISSEDEWYKAAYHKNDGVTGNYFQYPTNTYSVPSNVLGNPTDPGNNATYHYYGYTIGSPYYRTEVGAHENSDSPYGTFDQGGNIWEWNEAVLNGTYGLYRGKRGGSFNSGFTTLRSWDRSYNKPTYEYYSCGFRVSEVPEPGAMSLLALGALGMLYRRRVQNKAQ